MAAYMRTIDILPGLVHLTRGVLWLPIHYLLAKAITAPPHVRVEFHFVDFYFHSQRYIEHCLQQQCGVRFRYSDHEDQQLAHKEKESGKAETITFMKMNVDKLRKVICLLPLQFKLYISFVTKELFLTFQ